MEKRKGGCEKQGKATSQGLGELGFQHLPAEHGSSTCICHATRNSGKEHSKHYLSQITNTADHYFISGKAEAWGLGWVLVLRGGVGLFCVVSTPPTTQDTNSILQSGITTSPQTQGNAAKFISWLN